MHLWKMLSETKLFKFYFFIYSSCYHSLRRKYTVWDGFVGDVTVGACKTLKVNADNFENFKIWWLGLVSKVCYALIPCLKLFFFFGKHQETLHKVYSKD